MAVLVDANVILDVLEDDPKWANWSIDMLERCGGQGPLTCCLKDFCIVSVSQTQVTHGICLRTKRLGNPPCQRR